MIKYLYLRKITTKLIMIEKTKNAILRIVKRADKCDKDILVETFVNFGSLIPLLSGCDNHILYGRRGTGKTHVLSYLCSSLTEFGDFPVYIDLRVLGSTGSIYSNNNLPIEQRVTRLLIDVFREIHDQLIRCITENETLKEQYLSTVTPILSSLKEEFESINILGDTTQEKTEENSFNSSLGGNMSIGRNIGIGFKCEGSDSIKESTRTILHGTVINYLHFPTIINLFKDLLNCVKPHKIWIVLDEFSEIPYDLQPYLSDMLRRTIAPLSNIVVKIGAIEHRTNLKQQIDDKQYIGLEIGADIYSCNLDDYMVFNNNEVQALFFFRELLLKHINSLLLENYKYNNSDDLISDLFTQESVFHELVRASEGVPRDTFNILAIAVTESYFSKISISNVRIAAKKWYCQDKESSVRSYKNARSLLNWIVDTVIAQRHARAFLLQSDIQYGLIDYLYDARVLHIIKQSVSSRDTPGVRYNVYSIDYGCYVDLINTSRNPKGLFQDEDDNGDIVYCEVPQNDYRSIRRAILKIDEFESQNYDV